MRLILIVLTLAVVLLFSACGADEVPTATPTPTPTPASSTSLVAGSESTPTSGAADVGTYEADIKFLKHQDIEVPVGTTVVWSSELDSIVADQVPAYHTVTSGKFGDSDAGSLFDSGNITSSWKDDVENDPFSHTFDQAGEFPYFCKIHPQFMKAVVKVQ